jgi:hypothetical protein
MKVTGFSIIKNAVKFGYPIRESITSILPVCNNFILTVGDSNDGTKELIQGMNEPSIQLIDSIWDETITKEGRILAVETNKAFAQVPNDSDWAFYIQGDEVVHEKDLDTILKAMEKYKNDERVDGLLFNYLHFWGSFDYVGSSSRWYRNEIRVIRNDKSFYSYRDAQGFRKKENKKLQVKAIDAYIYHYGWVRPPKAMKNKQIGAGKYWGEGNYNPELVKFDEHEFDYSSIDVLKKFDGIHPSVMLPHIKNQNWKFDFDISKNKPTLKDQFKNTMEKITGRRFFDYKNYKLI